MVVGSATVVVGSAIVVVGSAIVVVGSAVVVVGSAVVVVGGAVVVVGGCAVVVVAGAEVGAAEVVVGAADGDVGTGGDTWGGGPSVATVVVVTLGRRGGGRTEDGCVVGLVAPASVAAGTAAGWVFACVVTGAAALVGLVGLAAAVPGIDSAVSAGRVPVGTGSVAGAGTGPMSA